MLKQLLFFWLLVVFELIFSSIKHLTVDSGQWDSGQWTLISSTLGDFCSVNSG